MKKPSVESSSPAAAAARSTPATISAATPTISGRRTRRATVRGEGSWGAMSPASSARSEMRVKPRSVPQMQAIDAT
jgi:hypothetical protein